jgi:hypothetical protein
VWGHPVGLLRAIVATLGGSQPAKAFVAPVPPSRREGRGGEGWRGGLIFNRAPALLHRAFPLPK